MKKYTIEELLKTLTHQEIEEQYYDFYDEETGEMFFIKK
jgi:hypothetical protein